MNFKQKSSKEEEESLPRLLELMKITQIKCGKYNNSFDEEVQILKYYDGTITLSQDHKKLLIDIQKPVEKLKIFGGSDSDTSCDNSLEDEIDINGDID